MSKDKNITKEPKEALRKRVEELKGLNAALLEENDMYDQFISRLDPQELLTTTAAGESAEQQLTSQHKCYVAKKIILERQLEQEKLRHKYEQIQDGYRASLNEAELRLEDIRRAKNEFERRLIKPLRDNRLKIGLHEPEKVLQYIKDKSRNHQLEKYRQNNHSMQSYETKLRKQVQQRRDMGKALYEEIFQEFSEQQTEVNLDEIRASSLKAHHALNSNKEKLQNVTSELSNLSKEIKKKEQTLERFEEALQHAEEERLKAQLLNQHLQQQIADFKAPDSTEYMLIKEKHRKLQQGILTWERKVRVSEMALKTYKKSWTKQKATITPVNSAETRARSEGLICSVKLPVIAEHKDKPF